MQDRHGESGEQYDEYFDLGSKAQTKKSQSLYRNYILFCICFSLTHGSMDSVLEYASSELGSSLAGYSGFVLYICYTISALFVAKPAALAIGPKQGIIWGLFGFICYVGSFFLSILLPDYAWGLFISGAVIGGIGAGIAWTAQGAYYSRNAQQYGSISHVLQTKVNADFAAIFAGIYLGFEAFTEVCSLIF